MSSLHSTLPLIGLVVFVACSPVTHYQLYVTDTPSGPPAENAPLHFEDDVIAVDQYLWADKGTSSFMVRNKSNKDIFIDLGRTHLVLNGMAATYYSDQEFTRSSSDVMRRTSGWGLTSIAGRSYAVSSVYSRSQTTTTTNSVTSHQMRMVCVPAGTSKNFDGMSLVTARYLICDEIVDGKKQKRRSLSFSASTSPLVFKNIVAYGYTEDVGEERRMLIGDFWVKEITNYGPGKFMEYAYPEECGERYGEPYKVFTYGRPSNFYLSYDK